MSDTPNTDGLSDAHRVTLASVLDRIIPSSADGRLPGAGALGLTGDVEAALGQMPALVPIVAQGLQALDELAQGRDAERFAALADRAQDEVLNELTERDPGFLPGLIFHCYAAYYRNPQVIAALGLEARPPYPDGYEMEANDFTHLRAVQERAPMFRVVR